MMHDKSKKLGILLLSFMMVSCSYIQGDNSIIQNRETDYLRAKNIPDLKIPPGLSSSDIHAAYPVAPQAYAGQNPSISLVPPGLED